MKTKQIRLYRKVSVIALIFTLVISISGCSQTPIIKENIKSVKTASASRSSIVINTDYSGILKPVEEINVSSKIAGKVEAVYYEVGQEVQQGQILFTLDQKDIQAQYSQSQASLDSAKANLIRTSDSSLKQQITQAETAVKLAQIQYDDSFTNYTSAQTLYAAGVISKQQMDNDESQYKNAGIQLDNAKGNLNLLKEKSGPQSINVANAQVEQAKAVLDAASLQMDNTSIASPISGIVSIRNVEAGEMVSNTIPAYVIINTKTLVAETNVSEKTVSKIQKGQKINITINALNKVVEGTVDSISPNVDAKTRFYTVKTSVDNSSGELKPGMFARVTFPTEKKENVLTVPNEAIVVENGTQYLYTAVDGVVKKKNVTTGISDDKITEITENLKEGESIILEGQNFLNEGDKVNVLKN